MNIIAKLEQKKIFWGKRTFILRGDGTLETTYSTLGTSTSQTVFVASLDPNPRRELNREIGLIVAFILLTIVALGAMIGAMSSKDGSNRAAYCVFGLPLSALAIFSGVALKKRRYDLSIFDFLYKGQGVVMYHDSPNKEQFEAFMAQLQDQIKKRQRSFPEDGGMADQLRNLAQLRDEGILTESEFISAKERVIDGNTPKGPIGFTR